MNALDTELHRPSESERVICWRATELIRAGFDMPEAVELAERADIDLHLAVELLRRGCSPDLATKILL